jgi:predicted naringenin-chalcone synthase
LTDVWLNRVGTAVPDHDIHQTFVDYGRSILKDPYTLDVFDRMTVLADIDHRYSFLNPAPAEDPSWIDFDGFYRRGRFPGTRERMGLYEPQALLLAKRAAADLRLTAEDRDRVTHLIVASCTGFSAPGLDFQVMRALGLRSSVERTIVGFMGCFAAVIALRLARHIVRSEPDARVLVVNVELSSLHLQADDTIEKVLSFLLFGDGGSAALVSADPVGLRLGAFRGAVIERTEDLITWHIGDTGFDMHLSGRVPGRIRRWLMDDQAEDGIASLLGGRTADAIGWWAVHAGGRSILDAVQHGLGLAPASLRASRDVLRECGNMSSATLMFVLARILAMPCGAASPDGIAMAFGPGLSVESFGFSR